MSFGSPFLLENFYFMLMSVCPVCICVTCMTGGHINQKMVSGSPETRATCGSESHVGVGS